MTTSKLNIDEIMALHMLGMPVSKILNTDLAAFDRLYDDTPELEDYINKANGILDRQEAMGIVSISCQDDRFPKRLLAIGDDCPAVIHCKGNISLLTQEKAVAIIGARSADKEGNAKSYQLGKQYAGQGYMIVSGLALGCDASAHLGCLDAGGYTIAIVGNGLDITHPRENKALETRILDNGGLLLSEQVIGVKANPSRLVARNRLQAALSEAVILAQCPAQSGSLHTMRFARKYRKQSLAATFPRRTEANAGNYALIDNNQAKPI
ncbi:MAG: DNA-protecting protein DprA [Muribaculum sp.]|nr:DNA-protecting protein DprA [Muribaculum sp.]